MTMNDGLFREIFCMHILKGEDAYRSEAPRPSSVVPAKAGIQVVFKYPAFHLVAGPSQQSDLNQQQQKKTHINSAASGI